MKIGVVFPQTEIGSNPQAILDYAQSVEGMGFSHVLAYEHVMGANPDRPGGWSGIYDYRHSFLSPFLLFSYMAGVTRQLEFVTGILILPQRQTALVAKQASTLDILSAGRFRLGVAVGWNKVEYLALKKDFHTRGKRIDEQVKLMRELWSQPLVNFSGEWETIPDAGINPRPAAQSIPIWYGGHADVVLKRIARSGDGWLTNYRNAEDAKISLEKLDQYLELAGRSRDKIGIEPRMNYQTKNPKAWRESLNDWDSVGATHISINTMGHGFRSVSEHLGALEDVASELLPNN